MGARRPRHVTTATAHGALGDKVSSTAGRSTSGNCTDDCSAADDSTGKLAALRSKRQQLNRFAAKQFAAEHITIHQARRECSGSICGRHR